MTDKLHLFKKILTVWKVTGQLKKFPDSLERFRTVWKVSRHSGKFLDSLESFRTVEKVSGQSGKFSDKHVICCSVFRQYGMIYALLYMSWKRFTHFCICCESDLRTFYMSWKWFTHFKQMCRGKNLRTLSGKFLRVKVCRLESLNFLGLWAAAAAEAAVASHIYRV